MPGLGETTVMLARMRRVDGQSAREAGASRLAETALLGANPGKLRMLIYLPDDLPQGAPLVVVLHGCGQDAGPFAEDGGWVELADRIGFAVLAPEQTVGNNLNRCFNWFAPADIERGRGEAASIARMIEQIVRVHGLDASRVFVTGLSAGGAMAAVMLAAYPEVFAGGAIIAGLAYGLAHGLQDAIRVMAKADGRTAEALGELVRHAASAPRRPGARLSIWQGDADGVVNPANAQDLVRQWTNILGLPEEPAEVSILPERRRSLWGASARGEAGVELNIVPGLAHGMPLSTLREGDVGAEAPFMLEVGVPSALEIAAFWGLEAIPGRAIEPRRAPPEAPLAPPPTRRGLITSAKALVAKALRMTGMTK